MEVRLWTRLTIGYPDSKHQECFDLRLRRTTTPIAAKAMLRDYRHKGWSVHRSTRRVSSRLPCSGCGDCKSPSFFAVRQRARDDSDRVCKSCTSAAVLAAVEERRVAAELFKFTILYPKPLPRAAEDSSPVAEPPLGQLTVAEGGAPALPSPVASPAGALRDSPSSVSAVSTWCMTAAAAATQPHGCNRRKGPGLRFDVVDILDPGVCLVERARTRIEDKRSPVARWADRHREVNLTYILIR